MAPPTQGSLFSVPAAPTLFLPPNHCRKAGGACRRPYNAPPEAHPAPPIGRGDLLTVRGLRVFSPNLGLSGACDVVEFRRGSGVPLAGREGLWQAYPVEYKRGSPKADSCDALQLCAQAMCLEEMLCCDIPEGALFYGEPRRREPVVFTEELRQEVRQCAAEMRDLYRRGRTPMPKRAKRCNACSLKEVCLPGLPKLAKTADYLRKSQEDGPCGNY